jgi:hypothetical protein
MRKVKAFYEMKFHALAQLAEIIIFVAESVINEGCRAPYVLSEMQIAFLSYCRKSMLSLDTQIFGVSRTSNNFSRHSRMALFFFRVIYSLCFTL